MNVYIKLEPQEEVSIRRNIIKIISMSQTFEGTGDRLAKLKKNKKYAMRGTITALRSINQEIAKIKEILPKLEKNEEKAEKKEHKRREKKKTKVKIKEEKSKYEIELEKIRKKIYNF